ncbi:MAG: 4-hydroxy-tetrahydrodipicolinate synthase [Clostridia bacterium]|nr:4-hydroxy-tetrahydrodipicolinate synthase [Clostridia bacterium]
MKQPKRKALFCGVATALATPFCDGAVDYAALGSMIEYQIAEGIDAIVLCGTTGEAATLCGKEYEDVVSFGCERIGGRVPTLVGCGSPDTKSTAARAKFARKCGADGILVVTPYYNRGTRAGVIEHYRTVAESGELPTVLYHVPARTGVRLPLSTFEAIAAHPLTVGIKEASGDMELFADLTLALGDTLALYTGNDGLILPSLSYGGLGTVSVVSNLLPQATATLCREFFAGNCEKAAEIQLSLLPLIRLLFTETNPAPLKCALELRGDCRGELRLPLATVEDTLRERIREELERLKS